MQYRFWKYIGLFSVAACCLACSDDDPVNGLDNAGTDEKNDQLVEEVIVRPYKLGTLAGFEGDVRKKWIGRKRMPQPCIIVPYFTDLWNQLTPGNKKWQIFLRESVKTIGGIIL